MLCEELRGLFEKCVKGGGRCFRSSWGFMLDKKICMKSAGGFDKWIGCIRTIGGCVRSREWCVMSLDEFVKNESSA